MLLKVDGGIMTTIKCPVCGTSLNPAVLIGSIKTPKKAKASRENGKKGGRPKGKKN